MSGDDDITPAGVLAKGRERLVRDIKDTEEAVAMARKQLAVDEPELQRLKAQLVEFDAFIARTLPAAEVRP